MSDVTRLLEAAERGDARGAADLIPLVYDELRRLAAYHLAQEKPGQTLQATALVHEAYLRLLNARDPSWHDHRHFFRAAAEAMRRILVDSARRKKRIKRTPGEEQVDFNRIELASQPPSEDLLDLNEALASLEEEDAEAAELVKLRYFAGLTLNESAKALGLSNSTADRLWSFARAWLYNELRGS